MEEPPNVTEFMGKFYERLLNANFKQVENKNLFNFSYPTRRIFRRLDAIARLLVGDEKCAAICIADTPEGKKSLLIATNNANHKGNKDPLNVRIDKFFNHIKPLSLVAYCAEQSFLSLNGISDKTREEFAKVALKPIINDTLKISREKNKGNNLDYSNEKSKLDEKDVHSIVTNFNNYLKKYRIEEGIVDKWWGEFPDNLKVWGSNKWVEKRIKRFFRDLLKIEEAFANFYENEELIRIIAENNLESKLIDGDNGIHAEMRLLEYLCSNSLKTQYIGISRLCCAHCNLVIQKMQNSIGLKAILEAPTEDSSLEVIDSEETIDYQQDTGHSQIVRGFHGKIYRWPISQAFKGWKEFLLCALLGEEGYSTFIGMSPNLQQTVYAEIENVYKNKSLFTLNEPLKTIFEGHKNKDIEDSKRLREEEPEPSPTDPTPASPYIRRLIIENQNKTLTFDLIVENAVSVEIKQKKLKAYNSLSELSSKQGKKMPQQKPNISCEEEDKVTINYLNDFLDEKIKSANEIYLACEDNKWLGLATPSKQLRVQDYPDWKVYHPNSSMNSIKLKPNADYKYVIDYVLYPSGVNNLTVHNNKRSFWNRNINNFAQSSLNYLLQQAKKSLLNSEVVKIVFDNSVLAENFQNGFLKVEWGDARRLSEDGPGPRKIKSDIECSEFSLLLSTEEYDTIAGWGEYKKLLHVMKPF